MLSVNIIVIAVTSLVSYMAFSNRELLDKLIFWPFRIKKQNTWYEFITHGFIHADMMHLIFNMFTLYFFGDMVADALGITNYLVLYFVGMALASVYSYFKHQDNQGYRALGASGAVSAILFAAIMIRPSMMLGIFGIIPVPAIIFGPLYLIYSAYEAKKGTGNIGHDAHFFGAVIGIILPILMKEDLLDNFMKQLPNALPF